MLVLSRKPGESVKIGDEVTITVLSISGKQVRLGINAPADIAVHREEIYNKISGADSENGNENGNIDKSKQAQKEDMT